MDTKDIVKELQNIEEKFEGKVFEGLEISRMANDCRRTIEELDRKYDIAVRDYVAATTVAIKEDVKSNEPEAEFGDAFYEPFIKTEKESIEHRICWGDCTTTN